MLISIIGSGKFEATNQTELTYFANSSVSRCPDNTILNGVISAGILVSDYALYNSPMQNYPDRDTAFKIRWNKKMEILSKNFENLYIVGHIEKYNHVINTENLKYKNLYFISHRKIYAYYFSLLFKPLKIYPFNKIIYKEIVRIILQFVKFRVDKPSTGISALIIALKNNIQVADSIKLNGVGSKLDKNFYYSKKIKTDKIFWNNAHEDTDQKLLYSLEKIFPNLFSENN